MTVRRVWRAIVRYFASPDPRLAIGNIVAFIVVGNQPVYPFYVAYAAGALIPAAFLVWLSTPVFLAAPPVGRRSPASGRAVLLVAAIGNTAVSTRALGPATGVELFYLPCLLVAWAILPPGHRAAGVAAAACGIAIALAAGRLTGPPLAGLSAAQAHALAVMNTIGVVCLTSVVAAQSWRAERSLEGSPTPGG